MSIVSALQHSTTRDKLLRSLHSLRPLLCQSLRQSGFDDFFLLHFMLAGDLLDDHAASFFSPLPTTEQHLPAAAALTPHRHLTVDDGALPTLIHGQPLRLAAHVHEQPHRQPYEEIPPWHNTHHIQEDWWMHAECILEM